MGISGKIIALTSLWYLDGLEATELHRRPKGETLETVVATKAHPSGSGVWERQMLSRSWLQKGIYQV